MDPTGEQKRAAVHAESLGTGRSARARFVAGKPRDVDVGRQLYG